MGLLDLFVGPPQDRFVRAARRALLDEAPRLPIHYDQDAFAFRLGEGRRPVDVPLAEPFRAWSAASGGQRGKLLTDFAHGVLHRDDSQASLDQARPDLVPVVRDRTQLLHGLGGAGPEQQMAWRPLPEPLGVALAIDSPFSITYVRQRQLASWGLDFEAAMAIALDNLRAVSPPSFEREDGGFYSSHYGDYLDASRLLLPDLFAGLDLKGDPVAVALSTNGVLVCGSQDTDALAAMTAFADAEIDRNPAIISCTPIVLSDGAWLPFPVDPASQPRLAALLVEEDVGLARMQERHLDEDLAAAGEAAEPAPLEAREIGGRLRTYTIVGRPHGDVLLPKAEVVIFMLGEGSHVRRWEDVEAVLGPLAPSPNAYPARYRISPPTEAQLERLRTEFACPEAWLDSETRDGMVVYTRARGGR